MSATVTSLLSAGSYCCHDHIFHEYDSAVPENSYACDTCLFVRNLLIKQYLPRREEMRMLASNPLLLTMFCCSGAWLLKMFPVEQGQMWYTNKRSPVVDISGPARRICLLGARVVRSRSCLRNGLQAVTLFPTVVWFPSLIEKSTRLHARSRCPGD